MFELFTDSAANLPASEDYRVLPLHCTLGDREVGEDFPPEDFFGALRSGELCSTSLVNVAEFLEAFRSALERGRDVVYVGLSHALSGTFRAAEIAAEELREEFPERRVEPVDSLSSSLGAGLLVLRGAELRRGGADTADTARKLRELTEETVSLLTVTDLKYLQRTGRLSGSAALIGGALNVKAVLTCTMQGECVVTGKARGTRRVLELMAERWKEHRADPAETVGITHADNESEALRLLELLRERGFTGECRMAVCDHITGAHTGPDSVGLFFHGAGREA